MPINNELLPAHSLLSLTLGSVVLSLRSPSTTRHPVLHKYICIYLYGLRSLSAGAGIEDPASSSFLHFTLWFYTFRFQLFSICCPPPAISYPLYASRNYPLLLSRIRYKSACFYAKQTQFPKTPNEPKFC